MIYSKVMGLPVTVASMKKICDNILDVAQKKNHGYVCVANVHMVVTARHDPVLRDIMEEAIVVTCDGMPLVWDLRHQGFPNVERVSGPDLMLHLCEIAQDKNVPIYFYGGSPKAIQLLKIKINAGYPRLNIAGFESPPMLLEHPLVDDDVISRIKLSNAGIVFVGLGCPKQEFWMAAHTSYLPCVLIGVGAAFDYISGQVKRAPLWAQRIGLEWFFRFFGEPKRLWRRYLITNFLFIIYSIKGRLFGKS